MEGKVSVDGVDMGRVRGKFGEVGRVGRARHWRVRGKCWEAGKGKR